MTGHYKEPYSETIDQLRAENKRLKGINADLLEALKGVLSGLPAMWGDYQFDGCVTVKISGDDIEIANEIIAKCEGK